MTGRACGLAWCSWPGGHDGNHYRRIGEVAVPDYNLADRIAVSVECGPGETDPLPVIALVSRLGVTLETVRLDWAANSRLTGLLADAANRFS